MSREWRILMVTRETINNNVEVTLVVRGGSMEPLLRDGDRVIVKKQDLRDYRVGDLVAFESKEGIYTHRLIKISNNILLTKGDNNFYPDPPILPKNVLGKIIRIERNEKILVIEGRRLSNLFLGHCHSIIGAIGQSMSSVFPISRTNFMAYWLGRAVLFPVKVLERILFYAG